jgi:hypothetical protein
MSDDMSDPPPICRMMLTGCKAGWYGYVMGRFDEPEWLQHFLPWLRPIKLVSEL